MAKPFSVRVQKTKKPGSFESVSGEPLTDSWTRFGKIDREGLKPLHSGVFL
jgi:hypothetical protein